MGRRNEPFALVAACRELAKAWADPNFITHLPVGFDHTCSGYQHHAMIIRDEKTGAKVNLIDGDEPEDVYNIIIDQVLRDLKDDPNELSVWWRDRLVGLRTRKILKTPIMTYGYSVSLYGMADQIADAYEKHRGNNQSLIDGAAFFLAKKTRKAVENLLPGPARVMRWARSIAQVCSEEGRIAGWLSPTNFPSANRYYKPLFTTLNLRYGGRRHRHRVAYGASPEIRKRKAVDSIAPNFVHSLDASHLVRVVNAAVADGISDILTVHDCFAAHAPRAVRLNHIIRRELGMMYQAYDALGTLQQNCPALKPPELGGLDALRVQHSEWLCI